MFDKTRLTQTLPERIAEVVGERITSGAYLPGERLVEAALAKEMKVSHGPIRDALRLLQNAGVVTIEPYRGAIVTEYSEQDIHELYQVRAALVGLRARWLAEDPKREEVLSVVDKAIDRLQVLARSQKTKEDYVTAALAVSETLTERLSNRWLRATLQALTLQTRRYTRMSFETPQRRRESARRWVALLSAMRGGRAELAQKLASSQSLATRDAAVRLIRKSISAKSVRRSTDRARPK
jgi:DNA-binding GntR family transcriptional regulator